MEEPAGHFLRAKKHLLENNIKEAARDIHKGINIINIEITRAASDIKPKLSNVAGELFLYINDLNKNKHIAENNLDSAFLRAEITLVQHKLAKADIFISESSFKSAAYALEAGSRHLLYTQNWSPNKLSIEDAEAAKASQEKMLLLIDGERWNRQEIIDARNLLKLVMNKV